MPEGDTIFKVAALMHADLAGRIVQRLETHAGSQDEFAGTRITAVDAYGKHLLLHFDDAAIWRTHLGMHGTWHRYRDDETWRKPRHQASIALWVDGAVYVCFNAKEVEYVEPGGIRHRDWAKRLGPDLLGGTVDLSAVVERARSLLGPETPLADVMLDQRVAAGIGNVYKSEVLYIERVHPERVLGTISDDAVIAIFTKARELLEHNLGGGRRVTRFVEDGRGDLWVYGRAGKPCFGCNAPIQFARLGVHLRSTYWCDGCVT